MTSSWVYAMRKWVIIGLDNGSSHILCQATISPNHVARSSTDMMTSSNGNIFRVTDHWALMFSLICVWTNDWVNNHEAGDLGRYRTHYDVAVMDTVLAKQDILLLVFHEEGFQPPVTNQCEFIRIYVFSENSAHSGLMLMAFCIMQINHNPIYHYRTSCTHAINALTHWPLGYVVAALKVSYSNTSYRLISWAHLVKSVSIECHKTHLMIRQRWFR